MDTKKNLNHGKHERHEMTERDMNHEWTPMDTHGTEVGVSVEQNA